MRLPLIARWPGQIPAASTCGELATSMDLLPTLARLAGTHEPQDRTIDGGDIIDLWRAAPGATSPHEAFFYYWKDSLHAVRAGQWKLHLRRDRDDGEVQELYDLAADVGETANLFEQHPEVVSRLLQFADEARADLGCQASGIEGSGRRPCGRVAAPKRLTEYDPDHPYMIAMYDLTESG
jgi:arylsulfatase A-like enzyme